MDYLLTAILRSSVIIPAMTGLVRFKKVNRAYHPFIYLMWLGLLNEIISPIMGMYFHTNSYNSNIYRLLEMWLILYMLSKWGLFERAKTFLIIGSLLTAEWITENFILGSIQQFNSYFTILYAFLNVVFCINMLNKLLISEKSRLFTNAKFLILLGFIIYFSYSGVVEIFWKYSFIKHADMSVKFFSVMSYLNAFNNILYTYAIICMRQKLRFTMQ
jgi:hypothetical protein